MFELTGLRFHSQPWIKGSLLLIVLAALRLLWEAVLLGEHNLFINILKTLLSVKIGGIYSAKTRKKKSTLLSSFKAFSLAMNWR